MIVLRARYISANRLRFQYGTKARSAAIGKTVAHLKYIQHRPGEDRERGGRELFDDERDRVDGREARESIYQLEDRYPLFHKLTIAPDINPRDMKEFTRELLDEFARTKDLELRWVAAEHTNTDNHHAHVLIWGRDKNGKRVSFDRDDFQRLRDFGDRYLERTHPEERARLREEKLHREIARLDERTERSALAWRNVGLTREYFGENYRDWQSKKSERDLEREEAYNKPITYRSKGHKDVTLDRASSLQDLLKLKEESMAKFADRLDRKDSAKLDRWIEDKRFEMTGVTRETRLNQSVVFDNKVYTKGSSREDLTDLRRTLREADRNSKSGHQPNISLLDRDKINGWYEDKTRAHNAKIVEKTRTGPTINPIQQMATDIGSEMGQFAANMVNSIPSDFTERDTLRDTRDLLTDLREIKLEVCRDREGPHREQRQREDISTIEKIEKARALIEKAMKERDRPPEKERVRLDVDDEIDIRWIKEQTRSRDDETDWLRIRS